MENDLPVPQTLTYYNWFDFEKFMCKEMNITRSQWRKYDDSGYKDFWHAWLQVIDLPGNDSFFYLRSETDENGNLYYEEDAKSYIEYMVNHYKNSVGCKPYNYETDWLYLMLEPLKKFLSTCNHNDGKITFWISW